MNIKKITFSFFLLVVCAFSVLAQSKFVTVKDHRFFIGDKPYYFIGTNYWYGTVLGLEKEKSAALSGFGKNSIF